MKNVQVTEEAYSSQKRPSNTSKHELTLLNPDPDPQPWYYGESVYSKFTRGHGIFSAVCYCHSSVAGSGNDDSCVNPLKKNTGENTGSNLPKNLCINQHEKVSWTNFVYQYRSQERHKHKLIHAN